ncbi:unnamed protein product, partial [Rotaria sp. Silwood2]
QHPQATTHLLMKYSESHVPVLYGPQIPQRDREDTRERYSRALLTLFVPWRTAPDICDVNQTWEDAFKSRKNHRDEHLLQVIAEAQTDNDAIDPVLLPANQYIDSEGDMNDSENLLELLGNLDKYIAAGINATKKP